MKRIHCLAAVGAAALLSFCVSAQAGKSDPIRVVPGSSGKDANLTHNIQYGNAKAREQQWSVRKVKGTGSNVDLAHGPKPLMSGKDPRFDMAAKQLRESQFQIAPLK